MRRRITPEELAAPLVPYEEARVRILAEFAALTPVEVAVGECAGLVAAELVVAGLDVPGFDNSAMDGYAIRSADVVAASTERPAVLEVLGDVPAGRSEAPPVAPGSAVTIMTGAPLPPGADAVVPWEDTESSNGTIAVRAPVPARKHVRPRGEDIRSGDVVVELGTVLRPVHAGVLASVGRSHVAAHPRPRVAVLSTGDELVAPGRALRHGEVYDANSALVASLCRAAGADVVGIGVVDDNPGAIGAWLANAAERADLIVTSGGASVGERDWMRDVLSREGEVALWRVAVKPGKPVALGRIAGRRVLVLPGNPGSVYACVHAFVAPAIRALAGRDPAPRSRPARLAAAVKGSPSRTLLCRVRLDGELAVPLPAQSSVVLSNIVPTEGFAIVPPGGLPEGAPVSVELID